MPVIAKQYIGRIHSSTKQNSLEVSSKKFFNQNLSDKRMKIEPKFKIRDLVGTANLKITFSKGDTTNWFDKLFEITEIIIATIPSYRIDILAERYNEASLKKTNLRLKKNDTVMKNLIIT